MGDNIRIEKIEFLYGNLYQIDLFNETKQEWYRTFIDEVELMKKISNAMASSRASSCDIAPNCVKEIEK